MRPDRGMADAPVSVREINPGGHDTVVFIHGWPLNNRIFEYQYNILPEFGYRCVGIDLRGFGSSAKPWSGYTYANLAGDIWQVVNDMRLGDVTLAGHSMGGAIAIRYLARFGGHRVTKLALLAAAAPSFAQRPGHPHGMSREEVDNLIARLYEDRPQLLATFGDMFFGRPVSPSFMEWFLSLGMEAAGYSTIKALQTLRDEDLTPDLPAISVPTGIFHGVLDQICPYAFALELAAAIPDSTLYTFENSGHAVFSDELDRFNEAFLQFLQG